MMARIFMYLMIIKILMAQNINNLYVSLGDTVEIKCPYLSTDSKITWFGPGSFSRPVSHGRTLYSLYNDPQRFGIIGNFSIGEYTLKLIRIRSMDLGTYKCIVTIENISYQHEIHLLLKRPPRDLRVTNAEDNIIRSYEGKEIQLECTVESGIPQETLTWVHKGIVVKESQTGRVNLDFIAKHFNHLDKYSCKANSDALESPLQKTVTLMISYIPRVSLSKTEIVQIIEGSTLTIHASVDSFPVFRNVTWFKLKEYAKTVFAMNLVLHFTIITRRDAGTYVCKATNEMGTGTEDIKVVVLYGPDITIQYENYTQQAQNRSMKCIPNGVPGIYTFYDWEHKSDFGDHIRFLNGTDNGVLTLPDYSVKSLSYQDSGYYSCSVSNGVPDSLGQSKIREEILLDIKGEPVFVADNIQQIYGEHGKSVEIVTHIYSNPKYTHLVILTEHGDRVNVDDIAIKIIEENTFINDVFHNVQVKVKGYRITLKILHLAYNNFQSYIFSVQNKFGQKEHRILLKYATTPGRPLNVSVLPLINRALVSWTKNFNGGCKQAFYIQYRLTDSDSWQTTKSLNDTSDHQLSWFINNLLAGSSYHFRMYSENRIGESNTTEEIVITLERETGNTALYVVISSISGVFIIAIIISIVAFRRSKGPQKFEFVYPSGLEIETGQYEEIEVNEINENTPSSPEVNSAFRNVQSGDSRSTEDRDNADENYTDPKDVNVNFYQPLIHNEEQSQNTASYDVLTP